MARRRRHEEHAHHDAWAIPYGDLVTLLLAFFVVMYAMSSVNEGKYRVLSNSLNEAFHGSPRAPRPVNVGEAAQPPIEQLPLTQVNRMITQALPAHQRLVVWAEPPHGGFTLGANLSERPVLPAPSSSADAASVPNVGTVSHTAASGSLSQVADDVSAAMSQLVASGQVHVRRYDTWVAIDISTDILFGSGVARLSGQAAPVLTKLADVLKSLPNSIRVEGHTDDRPINTAAFPSNWELSAARAASVVHLFMDRGVAPERLAVIGFGQYRPSMPNLTAAGRNANRRVEVVVLGVDAQGRDSAPEGRL
jgi:chemotaxis protein MotB